MNPSNNETVGRQLPPPVEQPNAAESLTAAPENVPGQNERGAERGGAPAAAERAPVANAPAVAVPSIPLPLPPAMPTPAGKSDDSSTTIGTTHLSANDSDLIEKEWVHKAKQIVERNRDDPYRQSEQLTEVKVDYIKKRYGKTIKLNK